MPLKRLKVSMGFLDSMPVASAVEQLPIPADAPRLYRRALLVYEGEFLSLDGPVEVTRAHLMLLQTNHNAQLAHCCRLEGGVGPMELPMKDYPPVQLDHSTSANDTVGRLMGEIELGPYIRKDGQEVLAAYGTVCFLGAENCEKASDGRYTHLSVGVDFEKGSFSELTVTPFPAAPEASLLSVKRLKGANMDEELKKRLKSYLTGRKKMSDEEAEKKLAHLSSDEGKEELSQLSAEADEDEKKLKAEEDEKAKLAAEEEEKKRLAADEDKEKKLSAARDGIKRLSTDFRKVHEGAQLAARKGKILTRLSALRSEAKISPAEIKKMDIDKLSRSPESTIEAVLKTYEDREPVIPVGQLGSIKADELHTLSRKVRMSKLEEETRSNMTLLKRTVDGDKLSKKKMEDVNVHVDATPHNHYDLAEDCDEIERLMDEDKDEAKKKLRKLRDKRLSYGASYADKLSSQETEKQLSALAESVQKMQTQFEELHRLAGELAGTQK